MKRIILMFLTFLIIMFPMMVKGETIDTTPPEITSVSVSKTEYNSGDSINLQVDVKDDISGIYNVGIVLAPKDDINNLNHLILISKSNLPNGVSTFTGEINPGVKAGKYVIRTIQVSDWAGNSKCFANDNVSPTPGQTFYPLPFSSIEINITDTVTDKTPPLISNVKANKNNFNVGEFLIVTMEIQDESAIKYAAISGEWGYSHFDQVKNNIYETKVPLKRTGTFKFYSIEVTDIYNNTKRYIYKNSPETISDDHKIIEDKSLDITVIGEMDTTPPTLKSVEISKKEVKLPSRLEIKVNYKDNIPKDIYIPKIEIYDAKTKQKSKIYCTEGIRPDDYSLTCIINLKQYEDLGEYYVGKIYLEDSTHNISEYTYENNTLKYYSFKIIADTNSDVSSSTSSSKVDEVIINSKEDAVISIDSTRNKIVKKSIFDNIKGTNKTVIIESNGIQWIFNGTSITNETKDINTEVNFYKLEEKDNKITDKIKKPTLVIAFANNGLLPGKCKVRIKADYALQKYLGKEKLYVYYYDEKEEQFSNVASKIHLTKDGYYEFYITHNSTYILTNAEPSKQYITKNDSAITYNETINDEINISEVNVDITINNETEENLQKEEIQNDKNNKTEDKSNKVLKVLILSIMGIVIVVIITLILIFRKKIFKK